jgi:DNA-directed RNA polymerase specialized sigma24 family protein
MHRLARLLGDPARASAIVRAAWTDALEGGEPPGELSTCAWLLGLVLARLESSDAADDSPPSDDEFEPAADRWAGHWKDDRPAPITLDADRLEAALARLPSHVAAVVVLRDVDSLAADEVEALLGWQADEQRALLHDGRNRIRRFTSA